MRKNYMYSKRGGDLHRYLCTVLYQSRNGRCGHFSTKVRAANEDLAADRAQAICRKRRQVNKIDGGSVQCLDQAESLAGVTV